MNSKELNQTMTQFVMPAYNEIPDVGLYLDQVVKFINGYFVSFPEMKITSSMVSNYVKAKLIPSPKKKAYSREQIAELLFIVAAKTVLSMDHIRICLQNVSRFSSIEEAYTEFAARLTAVLRSLADPAAAAPAEHNAANDTLENIVITVAHKMYLERYFDTLEEETEAKTEDKDK